MGTVRGTKDCRKNCGLRSGSGAIYRSMVVLMRLPCLYRRGKAVASSNSDKMNHYTVGSTIRLPQRDSHLCNSRIFPVPDTQCYGESCSSCKSSPKQIAFIRMRPSALAARTKWALSLVWPSRICVVSPKDETDQPNHSSHRFARPLSVWPALVCPIWTPAH